MFFFNQNKLNHLLPSLFPPSSPCQTPSLEPLPCLPTHIDNLFYLLLSNMQIYTEIQPAKSIFAACVYTAFGLTALHWISNRGEANSPSPRSH